MKWNLLLVIILAMPGCTSVVRTSANSVHLSRGSSLLLPPYVSATANENAGIAVTELTGTALQERGFRVHQLETPDRLLVDPAAAPNISAYRAAALRDGSAYILLGTVHEYDFKTDLDGSPAVGVTIKFIDPHTGAVISQGSSSKVGHFSSSLTSTAQGAVDDLLNQMIQTK